MGQLVESAGGYRFIPGVSQYSGGVVATDGYAIVRVQFEQPLPLKAGMDRAAQIIKSVGRPLTAFCACELRSPAPFTEQGFKDFNAEYVAILEGWGVMKDGLNPVARSNVCPKIDPPKAPSLYAFCYTVAASGAPASFVVSGSGEAPEGKTNYRDHAIRLGDISPAAIKEKANWVLGEMERRLAALSGRWADTTAVHVYTVHDISPLMETEFASRGILPRGIIWHYNRPPVVDLEFEMDCRRVHHEVVA